jgi:DNA-binding NtrC family response regulator
MERRRARTATPRESEVPPIVGASQLMVEVRQLVSRAARSNACVLITGEAGTGKDLVARSIHEGSRRRQRPFVSHHARSSSEGRLERDLEHAAGGTLYIDELFEIDGVVQARLSNLLEERLRKEDSAGPAARIVTSSSVDLVSAVARRLFREDVLRLVSEARIDLPALRLRREDIALLASALLARKADAESSRILSSDAVDALVAHDWPGNVRQLEAVLVRAAAVAGPQPIEVNDLPAQLRSRVAIAETFPPLTALTYREVLAAGRERTTRDYLVALLAAVSGNVTQAAERAGVERETFHRLLKRHGIRAEDFRSR